VKFRFPRQARLHRSGEFDAVYRDGVRVNVFPLRARALRREGGGGDTSRLGLAVSRRVGPAWVRNKWKRAIREAFRQLRGDLPVAYDVVVSVEWQQGADDVNKVAEVMSAVVQRLIEREGARNAQ
jgi:ribonuclease P protein component